MIYDWQDVTIVSNLFTEDQHKKSYTYSLVSETTSELR